MRRLLAIVVVALGPSSPAVAGYYENGNDIYEACRLSEYGICLGYVAGIADAAYFNVLTGICIPIEVQLNQVRDVVMRHLQEHPETRHEPAYYLANRALTDAWPCP